MAAAELRSWDASLGFGGAIYIKIEESFLSCGIKFVTLSTFILIFILL